MPDAIEALGQDVQPELPEAPKCRILLVAMSPAHSEWPGNAITLGIT